MSQRGQITVLVDERQARKAHVVLGTEPVAWGQSLLLLRLAITVVVVLIGLGLATIAALLMPR